MALPNAQLVFAALMVTLFVLQAAHELCDSMVSDRQRIGANALSALARGRMHALPAQVYLHSM